MERRDVNYRKKQLHPCRRWQTSKSTTEASAFASYQRVSDFSLAIMKGCDNIGDINLDMRHPPPPLPPRRRLRYSQRCCGARCSLCSSASSGFGLMPCVFVCVCGTPLASRHFYLLPRCSASTANFSTAIALANVWTPRNPSLNQPPRAQCLAEFSPPTWEKKHNKQRRAGCKRRFV